MIVFTTGTINAANQAAVGQAMAEKLRDDVVAHAAWDLVEEYTPGGSAVTWYVFKCLAAQSGLPSDFFVIVGRTIATGELRSFICEGYNAGTHVCSFYSTWQAAAAIAYDASGRASSTFTLSTAQVSAAPITNPRWTAWIPSGVSTKWWITVDSDGFTVAFNGGSNGFIHCGAYTPLSTPASAMPLHHMDGALTFGTITRNPGLAGVASASAFGLCALGGGNQATVVPLGFAGRLDFNDKLQDDDRPVAEGAITIFENSTGERAALGWALGKTKRMRIGINPPAGFAFGDAYSLQGRLWVPYLPTDGRMWDTGVAA